MSFTFLGLGWQITQPRTLEKNFKKDPCFIL
jgi:hypothetical protein